MGKHYSVDIKKAVVDFHKSGDYTYATLGRKFQMPASTVLNIINSYEKKGCVEKSGSGGNKPRCTSAVDDRQIYVQTKKNPFVTVR